MIAEIVDKTLLVFMFLIIGRSLMSWFPVDPRNPIAEFLITVTDPILVPLRRIMPRMGMFDLTPMAAVLLILFLQKIEKDTLAG